MKFSSLILITGILVFSLPLVSCNPNNSSQPTVSPSSNGQAVPLQPTAPAPSPEPSATPTTLVAVIVATSTNPASNPTLESSSYDELCDNDYFPSDEGSIWGFSGDNSKKGAYNRTDIVTGSREDGFTILTKLKDVSYTQEFTCSEAGLINLEPGTQDLAAIFEGKSGNVTLTRERNSGITIPRDIEPGDTWQQFLAWKATSPTLTATGSFTYHYTAMGIEVVAVPAGNYDAMRIDVVIDAEVDTPSTTTWTYTNSFWLAKDTGIVKSEGSSDLRGVEFTDTMELESYDSP